jgi:hypothetical protein
MEQGDEAGGGSEPENHEGPVFANERSLPEVELTQRDRGPGGLVGVDGGNLITRSGKNAGGSFRRAQHEPADNNGGAHRGGGREARLMPAAAPMMSETAYARARSRHCEDSFSGSGPGSNRSSRSPIPLSGTSRLLRRAGQVLRSGRVRQPHRQHSRSRPRQQTGFGAGGVPLNGKDVATVTARNVHFLV